MLSDSNATGRGGASPLWNVDEGMGSEQGFSLNQMDMDVGGIMGDMMGSPDHNAGALGFSPQKSPPPGLGAAASKGPHDGLQESLLNPHIGQFAPPMPAYSGNPSASIPVPIPALPPGLSGRRGSLSRSPGGLPAVPEVGILPQDAHLSSSTPHGGRSVSFSPGMEHLDRGMVMIDIPRDSMTAIEGSAPGSSLGIAGGGVMKRAKSTGAMSSMGGSPLVGSPLEAHMVQRATSGRGAGGGGGGGRGGGGADGMTRAESAPDLHDLQASTSGRGGARGKDAAKRIGSKTATAPDPRLDPTIDPKRAKRIMANRQSAARSKNKQREHVDSLRRCHDSLTTNRKELEEELIQLQEQTEALETDNESLQAQLKALEDQTLIRDAIHQRLMDEFEAVAGVPYRDSLHSGAGKEQPGGGGSPARGGGKGGEGGGGGDGAAMSSPTKGGGGGGGGGGAGGGEVRCDMPHDAGGMGGDLGRSPLSPTAINC